MVDDGTTLVVGDVTLVEDGTTLVVGDVTLVADGCSTFVDGGTTFVDEGTTSCLLAVFDVSFSDDGIANGVGDDNFDWPGVVAVVAGSLSCFGVTG